IKPVIVLKAGRHNASSEAAHTHTGALIGSDSVFDAALERVGAVRVQTFGQLFAAAEILSSGKRAKGPNLAIITNGGGMGVLATDELLLQGGRLATLSDAAVTALNGVLPVIWSKRNPVDIIGDAPPERLAEAVRVLLEHAADFDALLILNCPTAVASARDCAEAVVTATQGARAGIPLLTAWVGEETARHGRSVLNDAGIATYDTPGHAVSAFMQLVNYDRNQRLLMEVPPSVPVEFEPDIDRVTGVLDRQSGTGADLWLSEADAKEILEAYGIPVVQTYVVTTPEQAGRVAEDIAGPVALKILSADITHKSDSGGVILDLQGADATTRAAERMQTQIASAIPEAVLSGFTVQPMIHRPGAHELIVGMHLDEQFGPVLLFGQGGTAVEVINDRALGLPPLNMRLARDLIDNTRVSRLLHGYRNRPAADMDAIAMVLLRLSQLVVDFPELVSLDINPLLADERGVIALDARILLAFERRSGHSNPFQGTDHLAIRPYPKTLETTLTLDSGRTFHVRPILPEDEPALLASFRNLNPEEIRFRFLSPMKALTHQLAARLTQIDFDREMALVLTLPGTPGTTEIYGVVRIAADPDNEQAEFAVIIRHDVTGLGLGTRLMQQIIAYARSRGIHSLWGITLKDNRAMRGLAKMLQFTEQQDPDDSTLVRMSLDLTVSE
ncbi:MAG: GNAT family N-acetyltransferase, partial [Pseudomonadales bacterium]|nr:GNAT family N-acetyltransferase [Pseudomonadales bacterium]